MLASKSAPRRGPWSHALRSGAWIIVALGVLIVLALAGLHYYQQERLHRAIGIVRELGRAGNDLSQGFLHFALGGEEDAPWRRDQGLALLTQALDSFERAARRSPLPADVARAFRRDLARFRELLRARSEQAPSERQMLELRLALYRLEASADRVDRLLLEDLAQLSVELERAFAWALAGAVLLLAATFYAVHLTRREALGAVRLLEAISTSSTDAIFAKDREGRYLLSNKEVSRVTGLSVADTIGNDDRTLFPPNDAERIMANDRRVMEEGRSHTYEEEISTIQGPVTYLSTKGPLFDRDGLVVGMFGISRNITERKIVERAVQESSTRLERILESLDEGIVIVRPDGGLMRWNRAVAAMYEWPSEHECTGDVAQFRDVFELATLDGAVVPFEDWPVNRTARGERLRNVELTVRRIGGEWSRIHSFSGALHRGGEGGESFGLLTVVDVTARHQSEESLRRTQRMEALGSLAAGIAHDFNNILMAIAGNARLAQDELPAAHPVRENLHEIQRASARATDLVRSVLLFSRAEEPQRRIVQLAPLIEEALALVRPTTPAMIRFRTHFAAAPPVNIDPSQLHQVVVNLVTNSVHAIGREPARHEGRIDLALEAIDAGDDAERPGGQALRNGRYVRLTVRDNGCGMDQAALSRIFDPFFTTKPAGQGTGLGMSVVHGIVRNHDGAITVESQPGMGTSVQIYLPAARAEDAEHPAAAEEPPRGLEGKRVLYLDDEQPLVTLAARYLRKRGHAVEGFVNPQEAVRAFAAHPDRYDVVVTDMSMPSMSGFDVARAMLDVRPDISILMMSGYVRPEDRDAAIATGVKELMLKPSTIEELADAIDRQVA
jgi:PAS domain S-box-containing protein